MRKQILQEKETVSTAEKMIEAWDKAEYFELAGDIEKAAHWYEIYEKLKRQLLKK